MELVNDSHGLNSKKECTNGVGDSDFNTRSVRKDKKRQVKALIPFHTKEMIHRLSHVTATPLKDVSEFLTVFLANDAATLETLSKYFKRGVQLNSTFFNGNANAVQISKRLYEDAELISIKFKSNDYDRIAAIAYGLDCTPTRATAILLELASRNIKAVNEYVYLYMSSELTPSQMEDLRKVLSYVNRNNKNNSSWLTLLSRIVGDIRPASKKLFELVNEFLNSK